MGLKKFKPVTPGRRFMLIPDYSEITKTEPEKSLLVPLKKKAGRNHHGHVTVRHQGGGHKRMYRIIDFKRNVFENARTLERKPINMEVRIDEKVENQR